MSAFMVRKRHIDAMVTVYLDGPRWPAGERQRWETPRHHVYITQDMERHTLTPDEIGRLLWEENYKSVTYRYPDCGPGNLLGPLGLHLSDIVHYTYTPSKHKPTVAQTFGLLRCFEYQSSEHDGWQTSPAHRFVEQLKDKLIDTLADVRRDNTWDWDED